MRVVQSAVVLLCFLTLCLSVDFTSLKNEYEKVDFAPNNADLNYLLSHSILKKDENICFSRNSTESTLKKIEKSSIPTSVKTLEGNTLWIDEYFALGHAMYDLSSIQVVQSDYFDQIVLVRQTCEREDLLPNWKRWFRGYYSGIVKASKHPEIPIYLWLCHTTENMSDMKYLGQIQLTSDLESDIIKNNTEDRLFWPEEDAISYHCFSQIVSRGSDHTKYNSAISPDARKKFKSTVQDIVGLKDSASTGEKSVVISHVYRGIGSSRRIQNYQSIGNVLRDTFSQEKNVVFKSVNSSALNLLGQIKVASESDVVVCEHGAFQMNMIYMRQYSLIIDLRGRYSWGEFKNFETLAKTFGVLLFPIVTKNLHSHFVQEFNIQINEVDQIVGVINYYLKWSKTQ